MHAIEVEGLGKRYRLGEDFGRYRTLRDTISGIGRRRGDGASRRNELWALRDVSFAVEEGETVGVVGRNGAGKSTLLKILARITEPTEGVARMRGRSGALLEVGTGFHPELTGRENVYLNGSILGMTRKEIARRFDEIVAFAGVEAFLDTPLKRYSTGMELRLAFAVAAHVEPPIMVVDEVLAVGDAEFQRKCLGKMSELGRGGRTVVFVSHDLGAVQQLCPRTIWIDGGRVRDDGPSERVIERYLQSGLAGSTRVEFPPDEAAPVQLDAVSITDPSGAPIDMLRRTAPFTVEIEFTTRRSLPDIDVTAYVDDRRGVRVLDEAWSDARRRPPTARGPGTFAARVTMSPMLAPGDYSLGVWIGHAFAADETFVHRDVLALRVWPEAGDGASEIERTRILQPPVTWDMTAA